MTQGELEKIPQGVVNAMNQLEVRIMEDMVRRIRINGFSTASADWQFKRLQQLGLSEAEIKKWVQDALDTSDAEIEHIYSDDVYEEYMGHRRAYDASGRQQIPFDENQELQQLIEGIKQQTKDELEKITGSMGFVIPTPSGNLQNMTLTEYYQKTLDDAMYDISSGAFDYTTVLGRTINEMTNSGIRWIDYSSGHHNRIPVAARRAVMTGFRQVQGKINEQTARELGTDSYEVTVHIGARPTHQVWEGKVWTMEELRSVCGLGEVTGLHGANCYHDYNAFIPGVSTRTYTDEELQRIHDDENKPKTYNGKEYTTYEALQRQRRLETRARKYREDVHLLEEGEGSEDDIIARKCRYQKTLQEYQAFSDKMNLPMQKERIYQDGLSVDMRAPKNAGNSNTVQKDSKEARSIIGDIINGVEEEPSIDWPKRGKRIGREQNKIFREYGKKRGIDIGDLADTDLCEASVHEVIDDAVIFLERYPELRTGRPHISFTADYMNTSRTFAGTTNHLVSISVDAYRDLERLEEEYQKLVKDHWFPQGTDHHALIAHEIGHVIHHHYPEIDPLDIAMRLSGKQTHTDLVIFLRENLSVYSAEYADGREIISECYACVLTGTDNGFALKFVEECDKIIAKNRR